MSAADKIAAIKARKAAEKAAAEKKAEALPYFERLVKEFEKSEFLTLAQKRIAELKAAS